MTAGTTREGHPLHQRRDVLLLVSPVVVYLVVFSLFPLLYSLAISFFRWDEIESTFHFIGLGNYQELFADPVFWQATGNTAVLVLAGVALQLVIGTALAIFLDLQLRGGWFVRGVLVLPMLLTPVVVGLMWRALLNPNWGIVNYVLGQLGLPQPLWLADPSLALLTLVVVDSWQWTPFIMVIVFARLQSLPRDVFEAAAADGATSLADALAHHPAPAPASHRLRGHLPGHRRVPLVRRRLRADLRRTRAPDHDAELLWLGERATFRPLRLLVRHQLRHGRRGHRHGHVALPLPRRPTGGRHMTRRRTGRLLAYVLLVVIAVIGFAPFVMIVIYSTKSRIEILQVPPTLDFDLDQIVANYRDVLVTRGFIGFIENSIIVTAADGGHLAGHRRARRVRLQPAALPGPRPLGQHDPELPLHASGRGGDPDPPDDALRRSSRTPSRASSSPTSRSACR